MMNNSMSTKLSLVVCGGLYKWEGAIKIAKRCWKLASNNRFNFLVEIPKESLMAGYSICLLNRVRLIATGGMGSTACAVFDVTMNKWQKMRNLRTTRYLHASVCVGRHLFVFGGKTDVKSDEWTTSVECLNTDDKHGQWQPAPPMSAALLEPRTASLHTNVFLMGEECCDLYVFDAEKGTWSWQAQLPQNPGKHYRLAAGNGNVYTAGGEKRICWQYNFQTDAWAQLSISNLTHIKGALIFYQDTLLLLGGCHEHVEEYNTEHDTWTVAPYKLPDKLYHHYAFMTELPE